MPLRTLENWMHCDLYPTALDAFWIAKYLGLSSEYLVSGKSDL